MSIKVGEFLLLMSPRPTSRGDGDDLIQVTILERVDAEIEVLNDLPFKKAVRNTFVNDTDASIILEAPMILSISEGDPDPADPEEQATMMLGPVILHGSAVIALCDADKTPVGLRDLDMANELADWFVRKQGAWRGHYEKSIHKSPLAFH